MGSSHELLAANDGETESRSSATAAPNLLYMTFDTPIDVLTPLMAADQSTSDTWE
jgi:hypothetical protein